MARPERFAGENFVWVGRENDPHLGRIVDLPVYRRGYVNTSCWRVSFLERVKILLFGRVWLLVHAETHPPVFVSGDRPAVSKRRKR